MNKPELRTGATKVLWNMFSWTTNMALSYLKLAMICPWGYLLHTVHCNRFSLVKSRAHRKLAHDGWKRFQQSGEREDLDKSIALQRSALGLLPDRHLDCPDLQFILADYLRDRYDRWWRMEDLEEAIAMYRAALTLCPEGHPHRSHSLGNLASSLHVRYEQSGRSEDLEESIELDRTVLTLRLEGHPHRSHSLGNLAGSLYHRYKQSGRSEDLEESIDLGRAALTLRLEGHPHRPHSLSNLASSLHVRYRQSGRSEDLEESINLHRAALTLRPEGHFDRSHSLGNLANSLHARYEQSGRSDDLEEAINLHCATLALCPEGHPDRSLSLANLANSLLVRYEQRGRPEELEELIELKRAALTLRPEGHPDRSRSLGSLATSLSIRYNQGGRPEDLNESIELDRAALTLHPKGHSHQSISLCNLAISLRLRYEQSGQPEDFEESIELQRVALALRPEGHPDRPISLGNLANSLHVRYEQSGRSEDLEESIELHRAALTLHPEGVPHRSISLCNLANSLRLRYEQSGRSDDLEESIELHRAALTLLPEVHLHRSPVLGNLASSLYVRYKKSRQSEDLQESIELYRAALTLRPEGHPDRFILLGNLAVSLCDRYEQSRQSEDLQESIKLHRAVLTLRPEGHPDRSMCLKNLARPLFSRYKQHGHGQDFEECIHLLEQAAGHRFSGSLYRLKAARGWTTLARSHDHRTTLQAYGNAMLLLQRALNIGPTLHAQHDFLVKNDDYGTLALEAASYAIEKKKLGHSIELLEQGRALLWAQMRGFRTSLDRLAETNKELADSFQNVSRQLEDLATTSKAKNFGSSMILARDVRDGQDSFDKMLQRQRKLTEEQETLIDDIHQVPGFEGFLKPIRFETLRLAASEGPVIMINHCKYRCDVLIVMPARHGPSIVCIPLDDMFYKDSCKLCQDLVATRLHSKPDSPEYNEKLCESMKMIWDRAVSKVVDELKEQGIAEGARIWWCLTSVLSVLPFHAAGPYHGADGTLKYLLDDYISSYTPTLGSLINARSHNSGREPEILIVADTKTLAFTRAEVKAVRQYTRIYETQPNVLLDNRASHKSVSEGLQKATWVHFACHGHLDEKPFGSSFKLFDSGLTLLDIVKANVPNAEFAFLSACHTAEQPHLGTYDEVLHLSAAMQFCGFQSVIGTMWELYDPDGPFLAKGVYEYLAECEKNEGRYKRAAAALREAIVTLKAKEGIRAERWVNMIHIGA